MKYSDIGRRFSAVILTATLVAATVAMSRGTARAQSGCPPTPTYDTTPNPLTGIINSYYPGRETSASAGETNIDIGPRTGSTTVLAAGDLALVIQMQDAAYNRTNTDSYGDGVSGGAGSGSTALNSSGLYEYVRVTSVTGTAPNQVVNFTGTGTGGGLVNTYTAAAPDLSGGTQNGQKSYQVIRVPQYLNITVAAGLTAKTWDGPVVSTGTGGNGPTGGVLVFDVSGTLTLAGQTISVDGLGFRGGAGIELEGSGSGSDLDFRTVAPAAENDPICNGSKGEGIAGTPRWLWNASGSAYVDNVNEGYPSGSYAMGAPGNAGGGGTDGDQSNNGDNTGGGGGGNCGAGGRGGLGFGTSNVGGGFGGAASTPGLTRMYLGGGGGAGSSSNGSEDDGIDHTPPDGDGRASSGGAGGGIILVRAYTMSGAGTFTANGANAPYRAGRDGGGGGGAGGTIGLTFRFADRASMTATANGGNGGDAWPSRTAGAYPGNRHGPGGGGGGGYIATSGSIGSTSVAGGANGITTTSNEDYGSSDGSAGCTDDTYVFTSVPGVSSGGECNYVAEVEMVRVDAKHFDAGVLLTWSTASESDNLGFNIYRSRNGARERINRSLVAGAALRTSATMRAGTSYVWWDPDASAASSYWIEDVDFSGTGTVYGPYFPYAVSGASPVATRAAALASKSSALDGNASRIVWDGVSEPGTSAQAKGGGSTGTTTSPAETQWAVASRPALKLDVRQTGWYRVRGADLAAAGIDPSLIDPRTVKLFADGVQIPIEVSGESDGRFDPSDSVEFFGAGVDTPSTDTRVYYLTAGDAPGLRMKIVPFTAGPPVRPSLPTTVELKQRVTHFSALANGDKENIFGDVVAFEPLDQVLALPNVDPAASTARIDVSLQGVTSVPHQVGVSLNGQPIGVMSFPGKQYATGSFTVAGSLLSSGNNTVTLAPDSESADISLVDTIRVSYQRLPLSSGAQLEATLAGGRQVVAFGGFGSPDVRVVDATNVLAPQEILGAVAQAANGYEIAFRQPATTSRLLAFTFDQVRRPDRMVLNAPSSWNRSQQPFDAVFLTTSELAPSLAPLVALRQRQGYRVAIVDIEDVYDEFGFGYRSPAAIRAFIERARTAWSPGLRYVVIAGDGSFDPRNYFGLGGNLVPTKSVETFSMETFSDDWMADVNGDGVPDVSIGRLPVLNTAELDAVVAKILAYESQPAGPRTAVSVSDTNDTYDFGAASRRMSSLLPVPTNVTEIHRSEIGDTAARNAVLQAYADGSNLVLFAGHGSVTVWRGNLLTSDDAFAIESSGPLSVSILANCLNGYFITPGLHSVGEALVLAPGGGSVVTWSSSGTSDSGWQELLISEFLRRAYAPGMTTGDAARAAKASVVGDVRNTWVLLGDPMVKLK